MHLALSPQTVLKLSASLQKAPAPPEDCLKKGTHPRSKFGATPFAVTSGRLFLRSRICVRFFDRSFCPWKLVHFFFLEGFVENSDLLQGGRAMVPPPSLVVKYLRSQLTPPSVDVKFAGVNGSRFPGWGGKHFCIF